MAARGAAEMYAMGVTVTVEAVVVECGEVKAGNGVRRKSVGVIFRPVTSRKLGRE